jgi:hypothetical protein
MMLGIVVGTNGGEPPIGGALGIPTSESSSGAPWSTHDGMYRNHAGARYGSAGSCGWPTYSSTASVSDGTWAGNGRAGR